MSFFAFAGTTAICASSVIKMEEYLENGVLLAWYIDRPGQFVEIYRADNQVETVEGFNKMLSGENVLPGLEFNLNWMK